MSAADLPTGGKSPMEIVSSMAAAKAAAAQNRDIGAAARELLSLLKRCPLYFIGCMGSGKSAVARYVAFELGFRFLDTDELIEKAAGRSVSAVFEEEGEDAFRTLESAILDQVQAFKGTCVATGGGAVIRTENWGRMQTGIVIWLDAPASVLAARLAGDESRPLLAGTEDSFEAREKRLSEILESRRVKYEVADVTVPVAASDAIDDIAAEVFRRVANFIKENPPRFASKRPAGIDLDVDPDAPAQEAGA
jgi:shikimate kinase